MLRDACRAGIEREQGGRDVVGPPSMRATSSRTSSSFQASRARASRAVKTIRASDDESSSCRMHTSSCIACINQRCLLAERA